MGPEPGRGPGLAKQDLSLEPAAVNSPTTLCGGIGKKEASVCIHDITGAGFHLRQRGEVFKGCSLVRLIQWQLLKCQLLSLLKATAPHDSGLYTQGFTQLCDEYHLNII